MSLRIFTSQISKYKLDDGLDITYKTNTIFSPTKELVMNFKNGKISEDEYTKIYYGMMRQSYKTNKPLWDKILNSEHITLLCYCPENSFCHRYLLKDILVKLGGKYYGEI